MSKSWADVVACSQPKSLADDRFAVGKTKHSEKHSEKKHTEKTHNEKTQLRASVSYKEKVAWIDQVILRDRIRSTPELAHLVDLDSSDQYSAIYPAVIAGWVPCIAMIEDALSDLTVVGNTIEEQLVYKLDARLGFERSTEEQVRAYYDCEKKRT